MSRAVAHNLAVEVQVRLLGRPTVRLHEADWLELPEGKTSALLLYLASRSAWVSRSELLYLIWPDLLESQARTNLRQMLMYIRRLPYAQGLEVAPTRLRWPVRTDLAVFKEALAAGEHEEAVRLYEGQLLEGFRCDRAPEFENWLVAERETVHAAWREVMLAVTDTLVARACYTKAVKLLERQCRYDAFDEEVLRRYLQSLVQGGHRRRALVAFTAFRKTLQRELGAEPEPATLELMNRVEAGAPLETAVGVVGPPLPLLPPAGPFVGRARELSELACLLADPECRLLTLVGVGGVGKTRLALELALGQQEAFPDGVHVAPLAALDSPELMVSTIASALHLTLKRAENPKTQLLRHLGGKRLLLVLDNLEHLLGGVSLLAEMVRVAPGLKLLVTSRERLNLTAEWVFDLEGLDVPSADNAADALRYDAIKLFIQAARRVDRNFAWREHSHTIVRLCRLVEGLPLALELAAAWVRALPPAGILAEVERNLETLTSLEQDRAERHRSIRTVFEGSWGLLSPREQAALMKLVVFRGGLTVEAAAEVAGVTPPLLLSLVNKSLLRRGRDRFDQHALIHRYVRERWREDADAFRHLQGRHSLFFLELAERAEAELRGPHQETWLRLLAAEQGNLRAALTFSLEEDGATDTGLRLAGALWRFWELRGQLREGRHWLEQALLRAGKSSSPARAKALLRLGRLLGMMEASPAGYTAARAVLEEGCSVAQLLGRDELVASAFVNLAILTSAQGEFRASYSLLEKALRHARSAADGLMVATILNNLGSAAFGLGDYASAQTFYGEGLVLQRTEGAPSSVALILNNLGAVALKQRDFSAAQKIFEESLSLLRGLDIPEYLAQAFYGVAELAAQQGQLERAVQLRGVVETIRETIQLSIPASLRAKYEEDLQGLRERLRGVTFEAAWKAGRVMTTEQAVAFALEQPGPH